MNRPTITLSELADVLRRTGLEVDLRGTGDLAVSGVEQDSRLVAPGCLYLAFQGTAADGHNFVPAAREGGAKAAMVERWVEDPIPQLRVTEGRRGAAILAHHLSGRPTDHLKVVAVTGTNGKTTVAHLVRHLLSRRGPSAAMGTVGVVGSDGAVRPGTDALTTPGPVELSRFLAEQVEEGVRFVALEASSHALHQHRLDGIGVDVACFTNLTRDHLDYHADFQEYRDAKALLLERVREGGGVVVNGDDPAWAGLPLIPGRLLVTHVTMEGSDGEPAELPGAPTPRGELLPVLEGRGVRLGGDGSRFRLVWGDEEVPVHLPLLGRFNVENALVAAGAALLLGLTLDEVALGLSTAPTPLGRLELATTQPVAVILDYAHTPDALARVLDTLRPLYPGRLIVVFGAGGDRDRSKRPEMGRVAASLADIPIVTSDNPRTEDPEAILDDIVQGMEGAVFYRITERRGAIARALEIARPGDAVLLAGKGHETYQVVGRERRPFDERVVLSELLGVGREG